ncbi:YihY family inner membrane protein [soil metagenome]
MQTPRFEQRLQRWRAAFHFAAERLREERLADVAGSLTFTTVLSLVPLLTVALALFTAFPLFDTFRVNLQQYFLSSLMPDSISKAVLGSLNAFASKAKSISAIGGVFLVVTSVTLMMTIDNAFSKIWHVRARPPLLRRLTNYWAFVTVGPLLIGASITLSSVLLRQAGEVGVGGEFLIGLLPLALSASAFTLLYKTLPSKPVRWSDAFSGGLFAGIAFEFAKRLFALFIATFPTYTMVYGAFAAVPIFLIWVYLSWWITLLGAALSATLPVLKHESWQSAGLSGQEFVDALEVLCALGRARHVGKGQRASLTTSEIRATARLGPTRTDSIMERLLAAGWVARVEPHATRADATGPARASPRFNEAFERWTLIVDESTILLSEVFRLFVLEAATQVDADEALLRAARAIDAALDDTVADWMAHTDRQAGAVAAQLVPSSLAAPTPVAQLGTSRQISSPPDMPSVRM